MPNENSRNKQTSQSLTARCAIPRLVRLIAAVVNLIAVELRRPQAVAGVVAFELIIAARQRRCSVIVIIITYSYANKRPRIFAKTGRFKNSIISYSLNSLQCE